MCDSKCVHGSKQIHHSVSYCQVQINDVEMIVKSAENSLSILRHSGEHWSLDITNVWMRCPTGYNLRITNSSAYGVTDIGLRFVNSRLDVCKR